MAPSTSHWLAVRAMGVTAAEVASLLPEAKLVETIQRLNFAAGQAMQILDVERLLLDEEARRPSCPRVGT